MGYVEAIPFLMSNSNSDWPRNPHKREFNREILSVVQMLSMFNFHWRDWMIYVVTYMYSINSSRRLLKCNGIANGCIEALFLSKRTKWQNYIKRYGIMSDSTNNSWSMLSTATLFRLIIELIQISNTNFASNA
jgi:hypothetical protein